VTARLGVTYLRRHHEERELTMLLLVDESASAQVGSRRRTRSELAAQVAASPAAKKYTNPNARNYLAEVAFADEQVGRVHQKPAERPSHQARTAAG
jgi:uncharacterized protein (DUF58 family)